MNISLFRALFLLRPIFVFVLLGAVLLPKSANASIFSIISKIFDKSGGQTTTVVNSQNMPLLRAVLSADPDYAKGGGDVTIVSNTALLSETGPSGTSADVENLNTNGEISIYVVREGDSISKIAKMFGVSTNTIIWANDLGRNAVIAPGQTLVILPISGVQHTVAKGDTIQSIAKKYNGDADEIISYNNLDVDGALAVGTEITIPDGVISAPSVAPSTSPKRISGLPEYAGYFLKPIIGAKKTQGIHGYNGVDFGAPAGTEILAAASGQVIVSRSGAWNGGYGNYIVIKHANGTQTLYAHNSANYVSVGSNVSQGQVIGLVGSTGRSTGPHLHFEVRGAVNPF